MSKCILNVIDSLGVGEAPDAESYGDIGANTFGNVAKANGQLNLPTFEKLGFGAITNINKGINSSITKVINKRPSNKNLKISLEKSSAFFFDLTISDE